MVIPPPPSLSYSNTFCSSLSFELTDDFNLSYQELAGDLKLCSDDFTGAKNLYRLAGLSILKTALKRAVFGCVDQLLTYLQVNNFISRAANMQIGLINHSLPFSLFLTIQLRGRATFEKNLKFIPFLKIILYLFLDRCKGGCNGAIGKQKPEES